MSLPRIPVERMKAEPGTLHALIFENLKIGLPRALFYDLEIPLAPFDSGLPGDAPDIAKRFRLNFLQLPAPDWRRLDGRTFELEADAADGSIYLGNAHNPVDLPRLEFRNLEGCRFQVEARLNCDFEFENVALSDTVELATTVEFKGLRIINWLLDDVQDKASRAKDLLKELAAPEAYAAEPSFGRTFWTPVFIPSPSV
ncbi:MAG TPA: hypothetical protein VF950_12310 [Planctomycetota bacterium]